MIESWRDLLMIGVGLGVLAAALVAIASPPVAVYLLARHVGLGMLEAAIVALGLTPLLVVRALGGV